MSQNNYYKLLLYKKGKFTDLSENDEDSCIDSLDDANQRCLYLHREELLHGQLLIIKVSRYDEKVVKVFDSPHVCAVLSSNIGNYNSWVETAIQSFPNRVFKLIGSFEDLEHFKFDNYELLNDWKEIPNHERVLSELKCRCRSIERQLSRESDYVNKVNSGYFDY